MGSVRQLELPRHYVRLEYNEVAVLPGLATHATGVVVGARFDAPHWKREAGEQLVIPGNPAHGFELRHEVERLSLRFLKDLESWRLPELRDHEDRDLGRTARTLVAEAVDLPLTIESLARPGAIEEFCQAAIDSQAGAALIFAPYFTVGSLDDRWLAVNLRCLKATLELAADREVAAWIRLEKQVVVGGAAEWLARRYAAILRGRSSTVVLTVADMGVEMRAVDTLSAYLRLVRSFADIGLRVIVDGVGEFSPVSIAMGAAGSICGTRTYRNAPLRARSDGKTRRQPSLKYIVPERFQRIGLAEARRRTASGAIPRCPRADCRALAADGDRADLRHHNAHVLADTAALAQRLGPQGFVSQLTRHGLVLPDAWAQALYRATDAGARSAEA